MKLCDISENFVDLSLMANVSMADSGLQFPVWIIHNGVKRKVKYNFPRVKVEIDHKLIPYLIDNKEPGFLTNSSRAKNVDSKDIDMLNKWIIENYQTLIDHWNGLITDRIALNTLTHV